MKYKLGLGNQIKTFLLWYFVLRMVVFHDVNWALRKEGTFSTFKDDNLVRLDPMSDQRFCVESDEVTLATFERPARLDSSLLPILFQVKDVARERNLFGFSQLGQLFAFKGFFQYFEWQVFVNNAVLILFWYIWGDLSFCFWKCFLARKICFIWNNFVFNRRFDFWAFFDLRWIFFGNFQNFWQIVAVLVVSTDLDSELSFGVTVILLERAGIFAKIILRCFSPEK